MRRIKHLVYGPPPEPRYPHPDYPQLKECHLSSAKLYPSRNELILDLQFLHGGTIAEVGVARGDFSEYILNSLAPQKFVAFDIFEMEDWPNVWGTDTSVSLNGKKHFDFYQTRFRSRGNQVAIEVGDLHQTLHRYPDKTFDMIYIDAGHSYEDVKTDAELCKAKIKDNGILIFNDPTPCTITFISAVPMEWCRRSMN